MRILLTLCIPFHAALVWYEVGKLGVSYKQCLTGSWEIIWPKDWRGPYEAA